MLYLHIVRGRERRTTAEKGGIARFTISALRARTGPGGTARSAQTAVSRRGRDWISVLRVSRPPRGRARAMGGAPACLPACLPWASGPEVARLRTAPVPSSAVSRDGTA